MHKNNQKEDTHVLITKRIFAIILVALMALGICGLSAIAVTPETFTVTVTGGAGGGDYAEGETVHITLGELPEGRHFIRWVVSPAVEFIDGTSEYRQVLRFPMPAQNVTVAAEYEDNPPGYYNLTMNSVFYGIYPAGGTVTFTTGAFRSDGSRFLRWIITPEVAFADGTGETSAEVKFIMPACAVVIESVYSAPAPDVFYPVVVIGGMCRRTYYAQGETVTIDAYPPLPAGNSHRFVRWDVYPEVTFTEGTSAASPTAKFIMPASEVAALAVYESVPPKWWESPPLPYWLHCLLKYLCFGWLWMK